MTLPSMAGAPRIQEKDLDRRSLLQAIWALVCPGRYVLCLLAVLITVSSAALQTSPRLL